MPNPTEIYESLVDKDYIPGLVDENRDPVPQPSAGAQIRFTPEGIAVYMLWGKPGKFFGDHGQEFPDAIGARAGYAIEELVAKRKRMEAMAIAGQEIDAQYAKETQRFVELERGEYRLVNIGKGRYQIEFGDGETVTPMPLAKDIALQVMDALVPEETKVKKA